jgi:hypothetical protein
MTGLDHGPMSSLEWEQVDLTTRSLCAERRKGFRHRAGAIAVRIPINEELFQSCARSPPDEPMGLPERRKHRTARWRRLRRLVARR